MKFIKTYLGDLNFTPNFEDFIYVDKALWNKKEKIKFFKQSNASYVSQSLIENMYTDNYYEVETVTLIDIMTKFNHTKIDLLKMDIEGSEINVLLVEFDLKLKNKDPYNMTHKIINDLIEAGYIILKNDNLNITFFLINKLI